MTVNNTDYTDLDKLITEYNTLSDSHIFKRIKENPQQIIIRQESGFDYRTIYDGHIFGAIGWISDSIRYRKQLAKRKAYETL